MDTVKELSFVVIMVLGLAGFVWIAVTSPASFKDKKDDFSH